MYADGYGGWVPGFNGADPWYAKDYLGQNAIWSNVLASYGYLEGVPKQNFNENPTGVYICPSETELISNPFVANDWRGSCYAISRTFYYNWPNDLWQRLDTAPYPSMAMVTDNPKGRGNVPSFDGNSTTGVSYRHSGGANFLFVDGRVEWRAYSDLPTDASEAPFYYPTVW